MSLAKKCDICGKLYEYYTTTDDTIGFKLVRFSPTGTTHENIDFFDCCPNCMAELNKFINSHKKE